MLPKLKELLDAWLKGEIDDGGFLSKVALHLIMQQITQEAAEAGARQLAPIIVIACAAMEE